MGKKFQSVQVAPRNPGLNAGLHASLSPANHGRKNRAASSMVLVLVVTAAGVLLVAGVLSWVNTSNNLTQRMNKHQACVAAAGAATEKVVCRILRDFQAYDNLTVSNNIGTYRNLVPSSNDLVSAAKGWLIGVDNRHRPDWSNYEFSDAQGNIGRTYVNQVTPWTYTAINSRFPGLSGYCSTYRVVSNVRNVASRFNTLSGVKQDIVVASVPVFQYQVFYAPDLEINPVSLTFGGRVHCNGTIYSQPSSSVTFKAPVTASGSILRQKHPQDPTLRGSGQVDFQTGYEGGLNSLNLPLGTNTSPAAFHSIIELPPAIELISSTLGRQRLYNKADLIILVSNGVCIAKSGAYNGFSVIIPWKDMTDGPPWSKGKGGGPAKGRGKAFQAGITPKYDGIVGTNAVFFDARANKYIRCTEIDIVQLLDQSSHLAAALGRPVRTLYVADMRPNTASYQSAVRVVFGETLPSTGLTIVTPNPLYVEGDYNVPLTAVGTTNTAGSAPAALIADSITLLSESWLDAASYFPLTSRVATNTTVNAALVAGNVPTGGGYYSGGIENLPRLLEDWTGRNLTINGSFVCLYQSQIATAPWGASPDVYKPPLRKWSFDSRFNSLAGLPPSTPEVRTVIRRGWETVQANRIN